MPRPFLQILCVCIVALLINESRGESIVSAGFKKFSSSGSGAALGTWTRQSRVLTENNISKMAGELKKLESTLGSGTGFDIINIQSLSPQDSQVLGAAHFNYGSIFIRFIVFQDSTGQEYVNGLWFSSDPSEVFPEKFGGPAPGGNRRGPE